MNTNVNLAAPLGALAFVGTGLLITAIGAFLLYSLVARKLGRAKFVAFALLIVGGVYLGALLIFAFASKENVLAHGAEKHFCELDCHLAYSVTETKQSKTVGSTPVTANGVFTVVTIKTRFDEDTISPARGNGVLYPNSRVLTVIDDQGRLYAPSWEGQRALEASGETGTPLTNPLRPGESYTTTFVFDLPGDAHNPTLLINEGEWLTHFIIGHENSLLHKKTKFQL
jgi:hypothetical protein